MPPLTNADKTRMVRRHLNGLGVSDRAILLVAADLGDRWHLAGFPESVAAALTN